MVDELPQLCLMLLFGLLLGGVYYGGLWITTKHVLTSRHPVLWLIGSFLTRTALVLVGLFSVLNSDWRRPVVFVAGFVIARLLVVLRIRNLSARLPREQRT